MEHTPSAGAIERESGLREALAAALAAMLYVVNDAEPGEDAVLSTEGYNRLCAAIARLEGEEG